MSDEHSGDDSAPSGTRNLGAEAREAGQATFRTLEAALAAAEGDGPATGARQLRALADTSLEETERLGQQRRRYRAAG